MKKLLAVILALALALSMGTAALAEAPEPNNGVGTGDYQNDVKVIVNPGDMAEVYSVDIVWDDLNFTYTYEGGTWQPTSHTIDGGSGKWDKETANIKVTNHSNVPVSIAAKFGESNSITEQGVTATLSKNEFDLAAGVLDEPLTADNKTATVTITDAPTKVDAGEFKVDTVTVTVSKSGT